MNNRIIDEETLKKIIAELGEAPSKYVLRVINTLIGLPKDEEEKWFDNDKKDTGVRNDDSKQHK